MGKRTASQRGKASRRKGHDFERWVARQLRRVGIADARRQPQSQIRQLKQMAKLTPGFNPCLTDVVALPLGIECKHRKRLPTIESTYEQAVEDCGRSGAIPVAIHKGHGWQAKDIVVSLSISDWMHLQNQKRPTAGGDTLVEIHWPQWLEAISLFVKNSDFST